MAGDDRALQSPDNATGSRGIGCYYTPDYTFVLDVYMNATAEGNIPYQFAAYFVDFDAGERVQTVELMDRCEDVNDSGISLIDA